MEVAELDPFVFSREDNDLYCGRIDREYSPPLPEIYKLR